MAEDALDDDGILDGGYEPQVPTGAREHAVIEQQVDARARNRNRQLLQELKWLKDKTASPIAPWMSEGTRDPAIAEDHDPFLRKRRA